MFHIPHFRSYPVIAAFSFVSATGHAITLIPDWAGEALATDASYTFTTNNPVAAPELYHNSHGMPSLLVENETFFGTGWQDPEGEYQLTRVPGEGAWDLGQNGLMSITIPICTPGDYSAKDLEVFVNLVWYQGPVATPDMTIGGQTATTSSFEFDLVAPDGAGSWRRTVWSATFDGFSSDSVTLFLNAPWNGSVIDSVSVYTLIPEAGVVSLVLIGAGGFVLRRRRR